jgi:hypothetical protein
MHDRLEASPIDYQVERASRRVLPLLQGSGTFVTSLVEFQQQRAEDFHVSINVANGNHFKNGDHLAMPTV